MGCTVPRPSKTVLLALIRCHGQRPDDTLANRISPRPHFSGGWMEESAWPAAFEGAVNAMRRLYGALSQRVIAVRETA